MAIEKVKIDGIQQSRANLFRVPEKQWRKWGPVSRGVFNEVYSSMNRNQWVFLHPKAEKASRTQWRTTAWNAAWTAAGATQATLERMAEGR